MSFRDIPSFAAELSGARNSAPGSDLFSSTLTSSCRFNGELDTGYTDDYKSVLQGNKNAINAAQLVAAVIQQLEDSKTMCAWEIARRLLQIHWIIFSTFTRLLPHMNRMHFSTIESQLHQFLTAFSATRASLLPASYSVWSTTLCLPHLQGFYYSAMQLILPKNPIYGITEKPLSISLESNADYYQYEFKDLQSSASSFSKYFFPSHKEKKCFLPVNYVSHDIHNWWSVHSVDYNEKLNFLKEGSPLNNGHCLTLWQNEPQAYHDHRALPIQHDVGVYDSSLNSVATTVKLGNTWPAATKFSSFVDGTTAAAIATSSSTFFRKDTSKVQSSATSKKTGKKTVKVLATEDSAKLNAKRVSFSKSSAIVLPAKNMSMLAIELASAVEKEEDAAIDGKCDESLRQDLQERNEPLLCVQCPVGEKSVEPSTLVRTPDQDTVIDSSNDVNSQGASGSSTELLADDSEISRLFRFYEEMERSVEKRQQLSYYFASDSELIVHIESPSQDDHSLEARIIDVLQSCNMSTVKVKVKNYSVGAQLCSGPRVGSTIIVKGPSTSRQQVLGMYLEYGDRVYWVSTAHAIVQVLYLDFPTVLDTSIGESYVKIMHSGEQKVFVGFDSSRILPTPYLCVSYNNFQYSDNHVCHHSVDIMVGTVPLTSNDLSRTCDHMERDEMLFVGHRHNENEKLFKCYSTGVAFYDPVEISGRCLFNVSDALKDKDVYATLNGEVMVSGRTANAPIFNKVAFTLFPEKKIPETLDAGAGCHELNPVACNVMFIEPRSDIQPIQGHSGSVWFIPDDKNTGDKIYYKAVAITIGIVVDCKTPYRARWIATPLCAALYALSRKYSNVFPDYKCFKTTSLIDVPTE